MGTWSTKEERDGAWLMRAFGETYSDIARIHGRSRQTIIEWCLGRHNFAVEARHCRPPPEQRAERAKLRRAARIEAKALGVLPQVIYKKWKCV